jgi:hypothetical protein
MITINGNIVAHELRVDVPRIGTWHAQVQLDDLASMLTTVVIAVADGALELHGVVVEDRVDHSERMLDVVGGAGGWSRVVDATSYANDAGVKASLVAADVARACGESMGRFEPGVAVLGNAYVRDRRSAWATLLDVAGGVECYVDFDGTTVCAPWGARQLTVNVLGYVPEQQCVIVDDFTVRIGDTLDGDLLPGPLTVQRLVIVAGSESAPQCQCYCSSSTDIASQLEGIIERVQHRVLTTLCEYRVVQQVGDRLNLQPVHRADGLPDLQRVEVWGAVPGVRPSILPGARALVAFIGGSRARPVIVAFGPASDAQFAPTALTLSGNVRVKGTLTATGEVTANVFTGAVTLSHHVHASSGALPTPAPPVPDPDA